MSNQPIKELAVVIDTCVLRKNLKQEENLNEFTIDIVDNLVDAIERHDLVDKVEVLLPEVVLSELLKHRKDKINDRLSQLTKLKSEFKDVSLVNIEFSEWVEESNKNLTYQNIADSLFNVPVIQIPADKEKLFDKLFEMAINKYPPFCENQDKGFKDAIIFLSMVDHFKENQYEKVVFFTQDNGFKNGKKKLEEYFSEKTGIKFDIRIEKNIQGFVFAEYEIFVDFRNYLLDDFLPDIEKKLNLKQYLAIQKEGIICEIHSVQINNENISFQELNADEFEVFISVLVNCEDKKGNEITRDDVYFKFVCKKDGKGWMYRLEDQSEHLMY